MTKSELVRKLSKRYPHMLLKDLKQIVDSIFGEFSDALAENRRIEIRGFGAFTLRNRKARKARNPKTNEQVELDDRFTPYFRAGKELKLKLNNNDA